MIKHFFCILFLTTYLQVKAQDIKMGYLQIGWVQGYTFSDTTFLLTDATNQVNRPYILIDWGVKIDTSWLIQTATLNNGILKKYYGTCTYPGPGWYYINYKDTFRIPNISNMALSNTQSIKLVDSLQVLTFGSPVYTSPVMQNQNLNLTVQGNEVIFQPQFYDPDGDSLSFQLAPCFGTDYYLPNGSSIDGFGNVRFDKDSLGIYAFSILIKEWRKQLNGAYTRIQSSQVDFTMNIAGDVSTAEMNQVSFKIYPNPTSSLLNISDEYNQLQNATINITNYLGQTIFTAPFTKQIDISTFASGMYFLMVQDKGSKRTVKVMKE
jgi:hypothetical protein